MRLICNIFLAPEVKCMSASGVSREYMINLYREIKEKPLRFNSKLEETLEDRVLMRGYLYMQRGNWRTWTKRYFVLHSNQLCYYENEDSLQPRGTKAIFDSQTSPITFQPPHLHKGRRNIIDI